MKTKINHYLDSEILGSNMLDSDNYTLDFLKEKYEQAESRWKKESYLALMKMKGFDEKETEVSILKQYFLFTMIESVSDSEIR